MTREWKRYTEDELREFVLGVVDGRIFTGVQLGEHDRIELVFMPIAFGAFEGWTDEDHANLGMVFEYLAKASPRAINGMPSFMSMQLMHVDDWNRAAAAIMAEFERRKSVPV